jgi:prephenate dehydrogenase
MKTIGITGASGLIGGRFLSFWTKDHPEVRVLGGWAGGYYF